ncbi:MAG: PDZ domain-containing protein, partial [Phycisphaerales bacterium]|nr:PDZ domain-containing protein [Phycisphaerales bacterium]
AGEREALVVDTEGLGQRVTILGAAPGRLADLEAVAGGVTYLRTPLQGVRSDTFAEAKPESHADLEYFDARDGSTTMIFEGVVAYDVDRSGARVAAVLNDGIATAELDGVKRTDIALDDADLRVTIDEEWAQIFGEAWRLHRDFYWAPNMRGVDWGAMRRKYEALLPRISTRAELNDLIGQMMGELRTSHSYIFGGDAFDTPVTEARTGLLGVDFRAESGGVRIVGILPDQSWDPRGRSPLAAPHLGVEAGSFLRAIDGEPVTSTTSPYALLRGRAGETVTITIGSSDDDRARGRDIIVETIPDESFLRTMRWEEANRAHVTAASEGRIGYVYVPDMDTDGLIAFGRQYYRQLDKDAMIIDVRGNDGGYVSQMLLAHLLRTPIAAMQPREGLAFRYPERSFDGSYAVLIDQNAGSDGDIFPAAFRRLGLGPLIGMRTWGGVVGIRGDKAFIDFGIATQPEFAWRDADGWSIENVGVSPDIEVDDEPADALAGRSPQLDRAISYLLERLEGDGRERKVPRDPPAYPGGR